MSPGRIHYSSSNILHSSYLPVSQLLNSVPRQPYFFPSILCDGDLNISVLKICFILQLLFRPFVVKCYLVMWEIQVSLNPFACNDSLANRDGLTTNRYYDR